jgi:hypothetical protein
MFRERLGHGRVRCELLDLGNNGIAYTIHGHLNGFLKESEWVRFYGLNRFDSARSAEHSDVSNSSYSYQI